jgi:hypothetical protein
MRGTIVEHAAAAFAHAAMRRAPRLRIAPREKPRERFLL